MDEREFVPSPFPLLKIACESGDIETAMSAFAVMQKGDMPINFQDVIYAYLVSKKYVKWITGPNDSSNPLSGRQDDYRANLDTFQRFSERCELNFREYPNMVAQAINQLTTEAIALRPKNKLVESYVSSLCLVAQYFAERGNSMFNEMLVRKGIYRR